MVARTIAGPNGDLALVLPEVDRFGAVMVFSVRTGGVSPVPLDSLNFSASQGDSSENVRKNLVVLGNHLQIDMENISTCRQVHGDTVAVVDSVEGPPAAADAIITLRKGIFPAVKIADCLPILLIDPVHKVCAAVHAGWRGTVLRIARKVLRLMSVKFRTNPADLIAGLGPAIGPCCYEVDDVVLMPFRRSMPEAEQFITVLNPRTSGAQGIRRSHRLDLIGANRFELVSQGIPQANIHSIDLCTCCNPHLFFSHRRDGARSGRHIAIVGFRT